jgi:hypothetical protein
MNFPIQRRDFLGSTLSGLGGIALASMLHQDRLLGADEPPIRPKIKAENPFLPRPQHFEAKAKRVLVIFCAGAVSHVDTFDYKPELTRLAGQPMPGSESIITSQGQQGNLLPSAWQFKPRGQSGKMVSDLFPSLAELADDMCFIHSLKGKTAAHGPAETLMSTGFSLSGFPSMGSWMNWALGTENQDLPAFVAIPDPRGKPQASVNNWGSGFLPTTFQGTAFNAIKPLQNLEPPRGLTPAQDTAARNYLQKLNRLHLEQFPAESELQARIASYELAARMQLQIPDLLEINDESASTLREYGADDSAHPTRSAYARNCILARRLLEKGVRFVQLFNGAFQTGGEGVSNWDAHSQIFDRYTHHASIFDRPTAALLADLKQRGLLEDTLVVWCTEFGRMPTVQASKVAGRDHNMHGFTAWLAGAGVKAPFSFGATDDFGFEATENAVSIHDFHATIMHLMGLDHKRLTFRQNGTERRLTDVHGKIIRPILA